MRNSPALLLALTLTAFGQVAIDVSVPFGSDSPPVALVRNKRWFSLNVQVENKGAAVAAHVEVVRVDRIGSPVDDLVYRQPLDLPKGARKRQEVFVLEQGPRSGTSIDSYLVRVVADGDELASQLVGRDTLKSHFVVFEVTRSGTKSMLRNAISALAIPDRFHPLKVRDGDLTAEELPTRVEGYQAIDALILHDPDLSKASPYALEAISQWVAGGGQLLITGRLDLNQLTDTALGPLLPARSLGQTELDLRPLLQLSGNINPPAAVEGQDLERVWGWTFPDQIEASQPLICQGVYGRGRVVQLAFSPAEVHQPADDELFRALFLGRRAGLFEDPFSRWDQLDDRAKFEQGLLTSLSDVSELQPPNVGMLLLLLVFYVLAASLGNYLLLRLLKRRELSILTTPLIALSFGMLFYGIGYFYKGINSFRLEYTVFRAGVDGRGELESHVSLFSASKTTLDLDTASRYQFAPFLESRQISAGAQRQSCAIDFGAGGSLRGVDFDQWSLRYFAGRKSYDYKVLQTGLKIVPDRTGKISLLSGHLTNLSDSPMRAGWLLVGGRVYPVPAIGAGKTVSVDPGGQGIHGSEMDGRWMIQTGRLSGHLFGRQLSSNSLQSYYSDMIYGEGYSFCHALWSQLPTQADPGHLPALYITSFEGNLPHGEPGFGDFEQRAARTLLMQDVQIAQSSAVQNFIATPRVRMTKDMSTQMTTLGELSTSADYYLSPHGEFILTEDDAPLILEFETCLAPSGMRELQLRLDVPERGEHVQVELYNWQKGRADRSTSIQSDRARFLLPNPELYVSPVNGRVGFMITNTKPEEGEIRLRGVGLQVLP